ncbi:hypothetical protein FUA23_07095 [Neolewinella aurantiaca]|uniref:DUF4105 domain-containing protein n=1 Tax=Neolewinella aurantiaca TaxID=2602767 RepID=A0A5C7FYQ8_9BACT|nr:hypothetical protein [Neolewinella aurantiaca]TXF90278.1 hypothetical protein FUA23_07095 [Neolewinella aurantiaca]
MSRITLILLVFTAFFAARTQVQGMAADAYLVFYATYGGKTGHVGIAVDKNKIRITDCRDCPGGVRYDTVKTGEMVYFDLWPAEERYTYSFFFGSTPARYYRLPTSSAAAPVTTNSLMEQGLPHAMKDGVDGLARLPTSPAQDAELIAFMQRMIDEQRPFDLYDFNCSDFVSAGLALIMPEPPVAEERVLARMSTTPNRLWKAVASQPETIILKDPGPKADGRFNSERIFSLPTSPK